MKKIRQNKILQKLPVAVVGGAVKADVEVAELDPKIEPVDAGVLAKTDEGLDTFAAAELVAKGFETAAVVIIGIGLLKNIREIKQIKKFSKIFFVKSDYLIGVGNKACGEASDLEDVEVNELKNEVEVTDGGFDAETEVETVVVGIGLLKNKFVKPKY